MHVSVIPVLNLCGTRGSLVAGGDCYSLFNIIRALSKFKRHHKEHLLKQLFNTSIS